VFINHGKVNELIPPHLEIEGLHSLVASPDNMSRVHYIGLNRELCHAMWEICAYVFKKFPQGDLRRLLDDDKFVKCLHCRPMSIHQRTVKFFNLLSLGIYDDFQLYVEDRQNGETDFQGKLPLFANQVVFLWPLVCGSMKARLLFKKDNLHFAKCFRGSAAVTFGNIVKALGFTEDTYPFYDVGHDQMFDNSDNGNEKTPNNNVLRVWEGADFSGK